MSASCLILPAAAHTAAGGSIPTHMGFVLVAGLLSVACVALADRRRDPLEIATLLLLSQPALHALLSMAGHGHAAPATDGDAMVLAHLAAAGVLTILLSGAESVVWALSALSTTVLLTRVRGLLASRPLPAVPRTPARAPGAERIRPAAHIGGCAPRRGPPVAQSG